MLSSAQAKVCATEVCSKGEVQFPHVALEAVPLRDMRSLRPVQASLRVWAEDMIFETSVPGFPGFEALGISRRAALDSLAEGADPKGSLPLFLVS